jgi:diaphanous 1
MTNILQCSYASNPFSSSAKRIFYFCVPEEWYRRSKSRSIANISSEQSQSTAGRLTVLQESDAEGTDDEDGTARFQTAASHMTNTATTLQHPSDRRGSISQNRLSSLFDGWLTTSPTSPTRTNASLWHEKKNVSEPKLVQDRAGYHNFDNGNDQELNVVDFEQMLVCIIFF